MLITTAVSPYSQAGSSFVRAGHSASQPTPEQTAPALEQDQFSPSFSAPLASRGEVQWGPALTLIGGVGVAAGLAGSGLGAVSAVPALLLGSVAGFSLVHETVDNAIGNGRDSSGTGPISAFAGALGGVGGAICATSLALKYGSPMIGLGLGLAASALAAAGGAYVYHSSSKAS